MFEQTMQRLFTVEENDGDFRGDDGLLRCGKCGELKEKIAEESLQKATGRRTRPSMCACERQERERHLEAEKDEQFRELLDALSVDRLAEPGSLRYTFMDDDGKAAKQSALCKKYVDKWVTARERNAGVLLFGGVGNGKSFLASCIGNSLLEKRVTVCYTSLQRILRLMYNSNDPQQIIDSMNRYSCIIFDDFGSERVTEYSQEQIFSIVDARLKVKKPIIVTTNLSLDEMENPTTMERKRIFDRILSMCPVRIRLDGTSRRAAETARTQADLRELLA